MNDEKQIDLSKYLDIKSKYYEKLMNLYRENEDFPKKVIVGRNLHHKKLRAWSKLDKEDVDNSDENLVSLSVADHILAHYYIWRCAITPYKRAAVHSWYYMSKNLSRYGISDDTLESMIDCYKEQIELAYIEYCEANSFIKKGKKPKNFEYFQKKGNEAYRLRLEATKEERAQYRKERYTKNLQEQKSYRLETTKKKVLRCIEFDEVHSIHFWRSIEIRADKKENNLCYKGLHFIYEFPLKSKWKEPPLSPRLKKYLDDIRKKDHHWEYVERCDCCGSPEIKNEVWYNLSPRPHRYYLNSKWHLCYSCYKNITDLRNVSPENREKLRNKEYLDLYRKFIID